jgi:hypothetical protein
VVHQNDGVLDEEKLEERPGRGGKEKENAA